MDLTIMTNQWKNQSEKIKIVEQSQYQCEQM